VVQGVDHLPSMCKTLRSNFIAAKKSLKTPKWKTDC
jgi:hypothetical protein